MNDEVEALLEQLKAPRWCIRERAVEALMERGDDARDAVPLLIRRRKMNEDQEIYAR